MKRVCMALFCVLLVMVFSVPVMAAGNWRDGKKIYKSNCMSCHKRGGEAKRLKLNKFSKARWTKYFSEEKKGKHTEPWGELTEAQKKNLLKYFHKYAKDDKQILGCG
ncbi:MAG: cytochrome c [Desulfuromonas sp.]|nr:cytochrome c [Desulfuromonas sp.]